MASLATPSPGQRCRYHHIGGSQNSGYDFGGPHNKDYSILGSILGSLNFGKLPYQRSGLPEEEKTDMLTRRKSFISRPKRGNPVTLHSEYCKGMSNYQCYLIRFLVQL